MTSVSEVRARALAALGRGLTVSRPDIVIDAKVYVPDFRDNLLTDVDSADFEADLRKGSGDELVIKFRAAHSSSRLRRMTIGKWPSWSVTAARYEANRHKRDIDRGEDPMDIPTTARQALTVKELIDRFIDEYLSKLEGTNAKDQVSMLNGLILPDWRTRKVADITPTDVDRLLTKIALGRPRPSKTAPQDKAPHAIEAAQADANPGEPGRRGAPQDVLPSRGVENADRQSGHSFPQAS